MARSAAALVHGFASFDPDLTLSGVIFNRIGSPMHLRYLEQALEQSGEVTCLGGIPRDRELNIPERHLGLTTAQDHPLTPEYIHHLADLMEKCLDLDLLLKALPACRRETPADAPSPVPPLQRKPQTENRKPPIRLGVAQDRAFCFYYPENLEWLEHFGAQIVPFSPLTDTELPPDLHGLYLGGGYPELFAAQLAENHPMIRAIGEQARAGMPIYAECGGLMYLSQEITDLDGKPHAMAGLLPLTVRMLPRLKSLGYREIILVAEGLLGPPGTRARGHEFHYSEIVSESPELGRLYRILDRQGENSRPEGYTLGNVLASYVHLHFSSNPEVARHLVNNCRGFKEGG
jgi:cobyrinic acid a,c-diamide synthase